KHIARFRGKVQGAPAIAILNTDAAHSAVTAFLDEIHRPWANFLGMPLIEISPDSYKDLEFERLPESVAERLVTLSERCRRDYTARPYLRDLSEDDLLEYGGRLSDEMSLLMEAPGTPAVSRMRATSRWADLNEELNHRRI